MNPSVTVSVRNKQIAVRRERHIRGKIEGRTGMANGSKVNAGGPGVRGFAAGTQSHHQLTIRGVAVDRVIEIIRAIDRIVGTDRDPVWTHKETFTPGTLERSLGIKNHDRVISPVKNEDTIPRINGDRRDFRPGISFGHTWPCSEGLKAKIA
jgi:hypothetical protein